LNQIIVYNIDEVNLEDIFINNKIDVIIHAATNYGRESNDIIGIFDDNVEFPIKLLKFAISHGVKFFLNTDTFFTLDYSYMRNYTLSKIHFREWGKLLSEENKINFINLKLEHIYGPYDDQKKFIPWFIKQIKDNVKEIYLTEGIQKRDFIYIDDVVNAYLKILDNLLKFNGYVEFEVGTGNSIELRQFLVLIYNLLKKKYKTNTKLNFGAIPYRIGEPMNVNANNKTLIELGWSFEPDFNFQYL
jgi:CDP-paratose synthetase